VIETRAMLRSQDAATRMETQTKSTRRVCFFGVSVCPATRLLITVKLYLNAQQDLSPKQKKKTFRLVGKWVCGLIDYDAYLGDIIMLRLAGYLTGQTLSQTSHLTLHDAVTATVFVALP